MGFKQLLASMATRPRFCPGTPIKRRWILLAFIAILVLCYLRPSVVAGLYNVINVRNTRIVLGSTQSPDSTPVHTLLTCNTCLVQPPNQQMAQRFDLVLELGVRLDDQPQRWTFQRGYSAMASGDLQAATAAFEEYLISAHLNPTAPFFLMGLAFESSGQHDRATKVWREDPNILQFFLTMANEALYQQEDLSAAQAYLDTALEIDAYDCESRYRLAVTRMKQGDTLDALQALSGVRKSACSSSLMGEILYLRGKLLTDVNFLDEAIVNLRQAVELDSRDPKRLILLSDLLIRSNVDLDEAQRMLTRAVSLAPDSIWPYIHLCILERKQGRFSSALEWSMKAVKHFPEDPAGYHYTGLIYLESGKISEAIAWLKQALTLNGRNVNTWNRLGDAYWAAGQKSQAAETFRTVLEIQPGEAYAQKRLEELMGH
jgi:tetratricopeptide (TPR) repeat protein